jgi:hypothetical protein
MSDGKRTVCKQITVISPYDFDTKVVDVIRQLNELVDEHGPDVYLDWEPDNWEQYDTSPTPRYVVKIDRPETDEEYNVRMEKTAQILKQQKEKDLAEFSRLQKKLGL